MRHSILIAGIMLILSSCATRQVHFDELQDRDGLYFLVNETEPYTGEVISYSAGKVEFIGEVKDGLREGLWIFYYPSGQKKMEGMYKDGLKEGTWTYWAENGEQDDREIYKMGNRLGNEPPAGRQEAIKPEGDTNASQETKPDEPVKPVALNWDLLTGGPVKYYRGQPYTGPVVKYYKEGSRGVYLEGNFTNGYRSGKWVYYDRSGRVMDIRYY